MCAALSLSARPKPVDCAISYTTLGNGHYGNSNGSRRTSRWARRGPWGWHGTSWMMDRGSPSSCSTGGPRSARLAVALSALHMCVSACVKPALRPTLSGACRLRTAVCRPRRDSAAAASAVDAAANVCRFWGHRDARLCSVSEFCQNAHIPAVNNAPKMPPPIVEVASRALPARERDEMRHCRLTVENNSSPWSCSQVFGFSGFRQYGLASFSCFCICGRRTAPWGLIAAAVSGRDGPLTQAAPFRELSLFRTADGARAAPLPERLSPPSAGTDVWPSCCAQCRCQADGDPVHSGEGRPACAYCSWRLTGGGAAGVQ